MTSVKPPGRTAGDAWTPHLAALGALLAVLLLDLASSLALLARAAADPERTARLTALFWPGWSAEQRLAALLAADTLPVRESWIAGAIEVEARTPGAAARLRERGALLVLPGLPTDLLALGGCSAGSPADFPDRPALRKLRAGPM